MNSASDYGYSTAGQIGSEDRTVALCVQRAWQCLCSAHDPSKHIVTSNGVVYDAKWYRDMARQWLSEGKDRRRSDRYRAACAVATIANKAIADAMKASRKAGGSNRGAAAWSAEETERRRRLVIAALSSK